MENKILSINWRKATREEVKNDLDLVLKKDPNGINIKTIDYQIIEYIVWGNNDDANNIISEIITFN